MTALMRLRRIRSLIILVAMLQCYAHSQDITVPVNVQFPLIFKILSFDRNLKDRIGNEIIVGVVFQSKYRTSLITKNDLLSIASTSTIKSIEGLPIRLVPLDIDGETDIDKIIYENNINVLYIAPLRSLELERLTSVARGKSILTFTGVPEYVENGIAVGIGSRGEKPFIMINLPSAKAGGADFNSQLLNLAKVFH